MQNYERSRLTDYLINLTGEPISVYEESSGIIRTYFPQKVQLPNKPDESEKRPLVHYVVDEECLKRIRGKRGLSDIGIIASQGPGREGSYISWLVWGEDPDAKLLVRIDARNTPIPHL